MSKDNKKIANLLFEIGTMRKIARIHRQTLITDDVSDNIASHTFRVAMIGWFLAKAEGADPYKTVMMCLLHDFGEARSNDHNWVHKRYIKIFEEEILEEQLGELDDKELYQLSKEYSERESIESKIAKDADLIDQVLLLKEYEHQGNKETKDWLYGEGPDDKRNPKNYSTKSAGELVDKIYDTTPSEWWKGLWTNKNR